MPGPTILPIAISSGSGPVEDAFPLATELRVRHLELACQIPANRPHLWDDQRIERVRALSETHDVRCVLHSDSSVNSAETTPVVREAVLAHLLAYVDLAARLGSPVLVVHAGYHFDVDTTEPLHMLARTLREVALRAEDRGVVLALENMNVLPAEAEIRYLGCTAEEVAAILDDTDSPALGSCLDIGHAHLLPGGIEEFTTRLAGRIVHVQLTDNDGVHDQHLTLGEGTLDIDAAMAELIAIGYDGPVAVELAGERERRASVHHLRACRGGT